MGRWIERGAIGVGERKRLEVGTIAVGEEGLRKIEYGNE